MRLLLLPLTVLLFVACGPKLETRERTIIIDIPCGSPGEEICQTYCPERARPGEELVFCKSFPDETLQERLGYLKQISCHWTTTACSFRKQ